MTYSFNEDWEIGATWVYGTGQAYTVPSGQYAFDPIDSRGNSSGYYGNTYEEYTERNGYRLPAFHKLDLNFMYNFSWFDLPFQASINIYNAYNHKNTFAQSVGYADNDYQRDQKVLKRITLFPIIPTFGLSFTF